MTTEQAGAVAYALVIVWAIVMLLLLRYLRPAAAQSAQRTHEEPPTERSAYDTAWSASTTSYDRTPVWQDAPAPARRQLTGDEIGNFVFGGPIQRPHPTYTTAPAAQPAYQPAPAPVQPRPVVQPVQRPAPMPVQQPGIAVPNWPVRKSKGVRP